ncbi:MAG: nitric oxide reductase activation protein [Betaproteobacteria bacterium]|nr:nitric oxide reductase activation protein [Betaproteobacteria bacterium]
MPTDLATALFGSHEVEERLEELLAACLSSRRTAAQLVPGIAALARPQQEFVLHWVRVVAQSSAELAYRFAVAVPRALALLGERGTEAWLIAAMDIFDRESMYSASAALKDPARFARSWTEHARALRLTEVMRVLELFLCGLSGRVLRVVPDEAPWTDTQTVHLPTEVSRFADRDRNFLVYKAMVGLAWAQARFGTFGTEITAAVKRSPEPWRTRRWLAFLEAVRLDARIAMALPGLARDMRTLQQPAPDATLAQLLEPLHGTDAGIGDTIAVLSNIDIARAPPQWCYVGPLHPEQADAVRGARIARERESFRAMLAALRDERDDRDQVIDVTAARFEAKLSEPDAAGERQMALLLDGAPVSPPAEAASLVQSILQDLGELPTDYLVPAGAGTYEPATGPTAGDGSDDNPARTDEGAALYDEWDFARKHYRRNWCALRVREIHPGDAGFVWRTLEKYRPQIASLKRTFEALRGEDRTHRRQPYGDGIDIDAAVAGLADLAAGREFPERFFTRRHRTERSIGVMFLVDMSGSTKGWINDAEREALVLLCEALEVLGDRYAIYGFSGMTRKRCELYRVKRFDEPYGTLVKSRIAGITPQDYTRMGVAIRHAAGMFAAEDARTRLLVTLSDGKPDDFGDGYRGEYGIEDTRQALLEARRQGVHPFCITIDEQARDYLPHMYGAASWILIDDVRRLPVKTAEVYRRLTS